MRAADVLGFLRRAMHWLARRPAGIYLCAGEAAVTGQEPRRFARVWAGLMGLSLAWGLVLCGLWGLAWAVFRDEQGTLRMPPAVVLTAMLLGPLRQSVVSLLDLRAGRPGPARSVAAAVLVVTLAMALMALEPFGAWPEYPLPQPLWWLRPAAKLYRVLLLMPLWGTWCMLITPQFCRPRPATDPATAALARGCGALTAAACLLLPLAGTLFYFHYLGLQGQIVLAAAGLLGAIAIGLACCRLAGGLGRRALLAANLLTQLAFLVAFLACQKR